MKALIKEHVIYTDILFEKLKLTKISQLIFNLIFISFLNACDSNEGLNQSPENKTVTQIPSPLQKLAVDRNGLKAFLTLDGAINQRIPMEIDNSGDGTASVVLPGLTRAEHNIVITYEFTDSSGILVLAEFRDTVNLSSGSRSINIPANDYEFNFDVDGDNITNLTELLNGTNPRLSNRITTGVNLIIEAEAPILSETAQTAGQLRAFITLDGNNTKINMVIDSTTGLANITLDSITQESHTFTLTFEYQNNTNNTLTIATVTQNVDLTTNGRVVPLALNDYEILPYDEDGDGASNFGELLSGSDPLLETVPNAGSILNITFEQTKKFRFRWIDVPDATFYQLLENKDGVSDFTTVESNIPQGQEIFDHIVPLYLRTNAQYKLQSCNLKGCIDSTPVTVTGSLVSSIGIFSRDVDNFGNRITLSSDDLYLAVSSPSLMFLDNVVSGIYIFNQVNGIWTQQTIIRAPNPLSGDQFGKTISFNSTGTMLAIGADTNTYIFTRNNNDWTQQAVIKKTGRAISLNANGNILAIGVTSDTVISATGDVTISSGVITFIRTGNDWIQQAVISASNAEISDQFGFSIKFSADGKSLAIGAPYEDSNDVGVNGLLQLNNDALNSGAAYVFVFNSTNQWVQEAYIKPNDTESNGLFGYAIDLSDNGTILTIGARGKKTAYVFERDINWLEVAKILPSNPIASSSFGHSVSLSRDGNVLAIGDTEENSFGIGLNGDQQNNNSNAGAAYIFTRDTNWKQASYIKASDTTPDSAFGNLSLSGDGNILAVGAPGAKSVYLY